MLAMSGYAGPSLSRNRKLGENTLRGYAQSLKKECVGLAVGPVVFIADIK